MQEFKDQHVQIQAPAADQVPWSRLATFQWQPPIAEWHRDIFEDTYELDHYSSPPPPIVDPAPDPFLHIKPPRHYNMIWCQLPDGRSQPPLPFHMPPRGAINPELK